MGLIMFHLRRGGEREASPRLCPVMKLPLKLKRFSVAAAP